jgi:nucleoside-diphosphate-sugar epimerase
MSDRPVAILGATGPTGRHLGRELVRRGARVRVISRSEENLAEAFRDLDVERTTADALDAGALRRALDGREVVFDCIGLPADRMADHPRAARSLAAALAATGARCVKVSSYWSFLPVQRLPMTEEHPRTGGPPWSLLRREAEDVLRAAGAAVVHLPDFYGPLVHTSTLQNPLRDAVAGKPMTWIGARDVGREYVFVPDAMVAVAALSERDEAWGESWIVPGPGPITPSEVARIAGRHLDRETRVRVAGPLLLRIGALFSRSLRSFLPMVPDYARPLHYDGSKLRGLLDEIPVTPYDEAIPATLDALAGADD